MVYVIQVFWQFASKIRTDLIPSWSCSQPVSKPVWHIPLLCVQWKTPDDGQRNCPKHVEFYSKNKFEKLVHLVDFFIRIYHLAWSPECQIPNLNFQLLEDVGVRSCRFIPVHWPCMKKAFPMFMGVSVWRIIFF